MKKETTATIQIIKPILYILLYLLILMLMIQFLSNVVNADSTTVKTLENEIINTETSLL